MNVFIVLLFSILLPEKTDILIFTEKHIILNNLYFEYAKTIFTMDEIDMSSATFKEVLASLIDQITVIELNIISLACALFYARGAGTPDPAKANKCHKTSVLLSRYNELLTAEMFINAYDPDDDPPRSLKNGVVQLDAVTFASKIDTVKQHLKLVNSLFTLDESNYDSIIEGLGMTETFENEVEFFHTLWLKLWKSLGIEYIGAMNYTRSFLGQSGIQSFEDITIDMDYLDSTWEHILNMDDIEDYGMAEHVGMLQNIISLKEKCFLTKVKMEGIALPANFGEANWYILLITDPNSYSDCRMMLSN